jgi:V8-like Glu-specific endopeptidase
MDLITGWRRISIHITAVVLTVLIPYRYAIALDGLTPIDNGRQFACWETTQGNLLLHFHKNGMITNISFEEGKSKVLRQIRRISNKLRQSGRGNGAKSRVKLTKKLRKMQRVLNGIEQCRTGSSSPREPDTGLIACSVATTQQRAVSSGASTRIINGSACSDANSSTVEVLMYGVGNRTLGSCSGTVVSRRLVVSAAHCFSSDVSAVEIVAARRTYRTSTFRVHSGFNQYISPLEQHDVAVVRVHADLPVQAVPLLSNLPASQIGETGVIAGYGLTETNSVGALKAATVKIQNITNHSITIRYSGTSSHGNTCFGDSGGPLFLRSNGRWYLAGVTSNGIRHDCGAGDISNFTNLTHSGNASFIAAWMQLQ